VSVRKIRAVNLDWHADRSDLSALRLIDREPSSEEVDFKTLRDYRLARVRARMAERDIAACLLLDPVNIRYTTGARNMQVFHLRNPSRYLLVVVDGPVLLFEFAGCMHLAEGLETIDEVRPAFTASFVAAGPGIAERERRWASEIAELIRQFCGAGARVGLERVNAGAAAALAAEGFTLVDAQEPVELARAIKSPEELKCIRASIRATERAVGVMREALRPGMTENLLWSILHQGVIAQGGDYVETRLLSSGQNTNPWFQETGDTPIGPNELVALDTDVVGCYGYYCDFSRTFHAGPEEPSAAQKELYRHALEQVRHNMDVIRPGMTFREYADKAWEIPERYVANRYFVSAHGCGMTGEYPYLYHAMDFDDAGYDGVIEPRMTLCVESYIGEEGGAEGVKLEEQCLITDHGLEPLSRFPLEDRLL
jgi:Xaa-Pro dipeptidase